MPIPARARSAVRTAIPVASGSLMLAVVHSPLAGRKLTAPFAALIRPTCEGSCGRADPPPGVRHARRDAQGKKPPFAGDRSRRQRQADRVLAPAAFGAPLRLWLDPDPDRPDQQ